MRERPVREQYSVFRGACRRQRTPWITPRMYRARSKPMPWLLVICVSLAAGGCKGLGPRSVSADRFNYNMASAQSANEQMLLNIVRLRYGEPIHFLEIGSMLSQYTFAVGGELAGWSNDLNTWSSPALRAVYGVDGDPGEQDSWSVNMSYTDRPTITYVPLEGEAFAKRVMSPIPPATIIYLSQSGWSIDRLLECCVQQLGKVRNAPIHDIREADLWNAVQFRTVAEILKKIQDVGRLQLAVEVDPAMQVTYLYPARDDEGFEKEMRELNQLLGTTPGLERLTILPGGRADQADELVMETRSLLGVLNALAQAIDVPEEHIESGQVRSVVSPDTPAITRDWLTVTYSRRPQMDAFVRVKYNGYWWSIPKTDWDSKRTFAMLTYLFSLQATEKAAALPVVTVQAGG